ncbi:hypothetical protein CHELA40_10239 [Chelatococcus asaccharovorans]|nr:hypothetical protein CHELA40_10239 [Chelatococcus asaccharovorans]CAH1686969.1 hypothetical protein CHELA17_65370 [Chelatococcus asaccharovorans]
MRRGREIGDDLTAVEDRLDHVEVRQVAVADPGIVGEQDVAGLQAIGRKVLQHGARRARQGAGEGRHADLRLGNRTRVPVEQNNRIVTGIGDNCGKRRMKQRDICLIHNRNKPVPQNLQMYGIKGAVFTNVNFGIFNLDRRHHQSAIKPGVSTRAPRLGSNKKIRPIINQGIGYQDSR